MELPPLSEAREAVASVAARLTELLRAGLDPELNAIGHWNVGDVAAHLSHVYGFDLLSARGASTLDEADLPEFIHDPSVLPPIDEIHGIDDVARINEAVLRQDPERDLVKLADRIHGSLVELDRVFAGGPDERTVTWLGGAQLPIVAIAGHVLFEANGHGTDLARASRRRWTIDPRDVRMVFDGFLGPFLAAAPGIMGGAEAERRGCIDLRLRGQTRAYMIFDGSGVRIARDKRGADLHVSADPATFLLVMAGRKAKLAAALRGGIVAWGRRPLHGMRLMNSLSSP